MKGLYSVEALQLTPEQQAANEIWLKEFGERVEAVQTESQEYGWDSPQCQLARMDLFDWQQIRRKERANGSQDEIVSHCG